MKNDELGLIARYASVPGQSVGIRRDPPSPPPAEWRWGGPRPDGYKWPSGGLDVGLYLACLTCGAAVEPNSHELHTAWHEDR